MRCAASQAWQFLTSASTADTRSAVLTGFDTDMRPSASIARRTADDLSALITTAGSCSPIARRTLRIVSNPVMPPGRL